MDPALERIIEALIGDYRATAFLFDFDGTLVDLVADPEQIYVPEALIRNIGVIAKNKDSAFAVITGRAVSKLDQFLDGRVPVVVGNHGAEYRFGVSSPVQALAEPPPQTVRSVIMAVGERHDCICEDKIYSLALHLPFDKADQDLIPELEKALGSEKNNYALHKVGRTYEIKRRGVSKGSGIAHLMKQPGFSGRKPVYIGDDTATDESLKIVSELGGSLLPARHSPLVKINMDEAVLETEDVRRIIQRLAEAI